MMKFTASIVPMLTSLVVLTSFSFNTNAGEKGGGGNHWFPGNAHAYEKSWGNKHEYSKEFVHGIAVQLKEKLYYFRGPAVDPNDLDGATDIPAHTWIQVGKRRLLGKHYNSAPNSGKNIGIDRYWASDVEDGALLWYVEAVIDGWTEQKALDYYLKGYVRYSQLLDADTKEPHPTKVAWLRHVAATEFRFNGSEPMRICDIVPYDVKLGIVDLQLCPNWMMPYNP